MKEIIPNVYIGEIGDAENLEQLEKFDISHLVSICLGPVNFPDVITNHIQFCIEDTAESDLVSKFGKTEEFISSAMEEGRSVLVHCINGISRSATIIMAYIMASQKLSCPQAFRVMKKAYRPACPNEGFRTQLKMYEAMDYKLDKTHPEYRMYLLEKAIDDYRDNIGEIPLADNPDAASAASSDILLSCRKCRMKIGIAQNLLEHEPGGGQSAFRWHKRNVAAVMNLKDPSQMHECSSVFVEPMRWMEPTVENRETQGKLLCPKCAARFGTFNWSGSQCSCGSWITPSFQLNKARIDVMVKKEVERALAPDKMATPTPTPTASAAITTPTITTTTTTPTTQPSPVSSSSSKVKAKLAHLVKNGVIKRIVLTRHGKTNKAQDSSIEADLARFLTDVGKEQTEKAKASWPSSLGGEIGPNLMVSRAQRTQETARGVLGPDVTLITVKSIYPDAGQINEHEFAEVGKVFDSVSYAPLQTYLNHNNGALTPVLEKYAENVWDEALRIYEGFESQSTLVLFSHAVYISATARFAAASLGINDEVIRETNVGEVCCFVIDPDNGGSVKYITP